jgi:hypothetical protein
MVRLPLPEWCSPEAERSTTINSKHTQDSVTPHGSEHLSLGVGVVRVSAIEALYSPERVVSVCRH